MRLGPQLEIRRLEIAVDEAMFVCHFERLGDLTRDR